MKKKYFWIKHIFTYKLPDNNLSRCQKEQIIVEHMIRLYCCYHEGNESLCDECSALIKYTALRLEHCKFGNDKPTCQKCPIHCYSPKMKQKIKAVMRYSGPRMIFFHPIITLRHLFNM